MQAHEYHPLDVIFTCTVCGKTLDSIYLESDDNLGLRSPPDFDNGRIVKLWLTECAHLTCAKHLEGGGSNTSYFLCPYLIGLADFSRLITM